MLVLSRTFLLAQLMLALVVTTLRYLDYRAWQDKVVMVEEG